MDKLVSVIVPAYNVEKFLKKCVSSIINQTYKNLEIILVDDGSPDRSGALCDRFAAKDSRIVVLHKKNGGVSTARNAGIEAATGEYICFVDSDDWLPVNAIEILVGKILTDHSDFCVGEAELVGISRSVLMHKLPNAYYEKSNAYELLAFDEMLRTPWAKLFRTEVIARNNLRFLSEVAYGEDTIFVWNYLCCCDRMSIIDLPAYCYSQLNSNNASSKYYHQLADWQYIYVKAMECVVNGSSLPKEEKRKIVCKMVMKNVFFVGWAYARWLDEKQRYQLEERLKHTVDVFRDYLSDDALEFSADMTEKQKILNMYIIPEDYNGLAEYYLRITHSHRKNVVEQVVRNLALWCKQKWVYSFLR